MKIAINAGHTLRGRGTGAVGYLNEMKENRKIAQRVTQLLKEVGHEVVDCTIDESSNDLKEAVVRANNANVDLFCSIHLNAGGGGNPDTGNGQIIVGSKVKVTGTHWATGQSIPSWVKNEKYIVGKIEGDRALLEGINSWAYLKDLVLISGGGNPEPDNGDVAYDAQGKVINVTSTLNVRSGPSTSHSVIGTLTGDAVVKIIAKNNGWYKISSPLNGYVSQNYIQIIDDNHCENWHTNSQYHRVLEWKYPHICGEDVKLLQRQIKILGFDTKETGIYDLDTCNQVRRYETINKLIIDGIVKQDLWNYIFDDFNLLKNTGLFFENNSFEIQRFNVKSPELILTTNPLTTISAEIATTGTIGSGKKISLFKNKSEVTSYINTELGNNFGAVIDFSAADMVKSFTGVSYANVVSDHLTIYSNYDILKNTITIILETKVTVANLLKSIRGEKMINATGYHRTYITCYGSRKPDSNENEFGQVLLEERIDELTNNKTTALLWVPIAIFIGVGAVAISGKAMLSAAGIALISTAMFDAIE